MELRGQYDVGVWCEYKRVGKRLHQVDVFCGVVVNGVGLDKPQCRTVDECVEQILEDYRWEVERMKERPHPPPDPAKELLREYPELGVLVWGVCGLGVWVVGALKFI